jgi:hypothetical protein
MLRNWYVHVYANVVTGHCNVQPVRGQSRVHDRSSVFNFTLYTTSEALDQPSCPGAIMKEQGGGCRLTRFYASEMCVVGMHWVISASRPIQRAIFLTADSAAVQFGSAVLHEILLQPVIDV